MMNKNTGILYRYELKKIMRSKLTIAMMIILVLVVLLAGLSPGEKETREVRDYQHVLNGRAIDNDLLNEMYPLIDDYAVTWNAENAAYERVAYVEKCIVGDGERLSDYTADEMYGIRESDLMEVMAMDRLSDDEIAWWAGQEDKVAKPFIYNYSGGPVALARGLSAVCLAMLLFAAMCLSTVFAGEHRQRTDQIVLSCVNGRKETCFAKLAAGMSFVLGAFIVSFAMLALIIFLRKGLDGMEAMVQLEVPFSAYPLTIDRFIAIQFVLILAASVLFAAAAMAFSEIFRNGLAVMGLLTGCYLVTQIVSIPARYRIPSQIMCWMPTEIADLASLMDHRLVGIGGHYITSFHIAPVLYLFLTVILYAAGSRMYCRFQVSGR